MEENTLSRNKKDKMLVIIIAGLSLILIALFIFFMLEKAENKTNLPSGIYRLPSPFTKRSFDSAYASLRMTIRSTNYL